MLTVMLKMEGMMFSPGFLSRFFYGVLFFDGGKLFQTANIKRNFGSATKPKLRTHFSCSML